MKNTQHCRQIWCILLKQEFIIPLNTLIRENYNGATKVWATNQTTFKAFNDHFHREKCRASSAVIGASRVHRARRLAKGVRVRGNAG